MVDYFQRKKTIRNFKLGYPLASNHSHHIGHNYGLKARHPSSVLRAETERENMDTETRVEELVPEEILQNNLTT